MRNHSKNTLKRIARRDYDNLFRGNLIQIKARRQGLTASAQKSLSVMFSPYLTPSLVHLNRKLRMVKTPRELKGVRVELDALRSIQFKKGDQGAYDGSGYNSFEELWKLEESRLFMPTYNRLFIPNGINQAESTTQSPRQQQN